MVFIAAAMLLVASVVGKLVGMHIAGKILKWAPGEASICRLAAANQSAHHDHFRQHKGLITSEAFTALLLMAVASTMLTIPVVYTKLHGVKSLIS